MWQGHRWQKETPDKKQGKHRFSGTWRVTIRCSRNYLGFEYLRCKVRGEDLQISTVTFSSQSQSFQAHDHLLSPSPRPGAPIGASGSPGSMPLFDGRRGHSVGYEECQIQRQKGRSHLITELSRPGARGLPLGPGPWSKDLN